MHLFERRRKFEQVFENYYRQVLSKRAYNQLIRGLEQPLDDFWSTILLPNTIVDPDGCPIDLATAGPVEAMSMIESLSDMKSLPDDLNDRHAYSYLTSSKYEQGRPQTGPLIHLDRRDPNTTALIDPRSHLSFFTNYQRFSRPSDASWNHPSERVVIGPYTYFTIEIDPPSEWEVEQKIGLLEEQMSWLRRSGDSKRSAPIYKIIDWVRRFSDYRGMVAVYSGNKSLHFTFVFATGDIALGRPELHNQFRPVYIEAFQRLSTGFQDLLPTSAQHDGNMAYPEQLRRLPNGTHFVGNQAKHIFAVPERTEVAQVVLFEELLRKAPAGADRRFIDANEIARMAVSLPTKVCGGPSMMRGTLGPWSCEMEREFCEQRLRVEVEKRADPNGYPSLADLIYEGQIKARFYADENDQHPGVVMFEDNSAPIVMGGRAPSRRIDLGLSLGHHIRRWRREWFRENPDIVTTGVLDEENNSVALIVPKQSDHALPDSCEMFRSTLPKALADHDVVLARGAEGLGKTTTSMLMIPDLVARYMEKVTAKHGERSQHHEATTAMSRYSAVATASYEQRDDKCDQYNSLIDPKLSFGVRFDSFDQTYQIALKAVYGDEWQDFKITTGNAPDLNERAVIRAIQSRQPNVWSEMKRLHDAVMEPVRSAPPGQHVVLFMVHDVMHQWTEGGLSRIFAHPDFFATSVEDFWKLRDQTGLVVAIHDELAVEHFIHLAKLSNVRWCEGLFDTYQVWSEDSLDLVGAKASWRAYADSTVGEVGFEETVAIHRSGLSSKREIGVGPVETYGVSKRSGKAWGMYHSRHTRRYAYLARSWWEGLAAKTVLLTTEALPTAIFDACADPDRSVVLALPQVAVGKGRIEAHIFPSLKSSENVTVAEALRDIEDLTDAHVLCNKGDQLDDQTTLVKAKGSNKLAHTDIIQIANYVSPDGDQEIGQYDQLQVINAVFGIRNALRLWHVDMINQMAGRNLGHRYQGHRHILAISQSLYNLIEATLIDHCRYPIDRIEKADRRRNRKHNDDLALLERLEREQLDERHRFDMCQEHKALADLDIRIDAAAEQYRQDQYPEFA